MTATDFSPLEISFFRQIVSLPSSRHSPSLVFGNHIQADPSDTRDRHFPPRQFHRIQRRSPPFLKAEKHTVQDSSRSASTRLCGQRLARQVYVRWPGLLDVLRRSVSRTEDANTYRRGRFSLGIRAQLELDTYLKQEFGDWIISCKSCHKPVFSVGLASRLIWGY
jgi:hypothetical protein